MRGRKKGEREVISDIPYWKIIFGIHMYTSPVIFLIDLELSL